MGTNLKSTIVNELTKYKFTILAVGIILASTALYFYQENKESEEIGQFEVKIIYCDPNGTCR